MSLPGTIARTMMGPPSVQCDFCTGSEISGHFDGCPMVTTMPRILAALEAYGRCLDSMARVWGKAQGTERAEYKQYVEMGDILYHATGGERGRCGGYTGSPCAEEGAGS